MMKNNPNIDIIEKSTKERTENKMNELIENEQERRIIKKIRKDSDAIAIFTFKNVKKGILIGKYLEGDFYTQHLICMIELLNKTLYNIFAYENEISNELLFSKEMPDFQKALKGMDPAEMQHHLIYAFDLLNDLEDLCSEDGYEKDGWGSRKNR